MEEGKDMQKKKKNGNGIIYWDFELANNEITIVQYKNNFLYIIVKIGCRCYYCSPIL